MLATTATANARVVEDVAEQLAVSRHGVGTGHDVSADGGYKVRTLRGPLAPRLAPHRRVDCS